jgi:NADH-quinone oxidoreductase subunit B
VPLAPAAPSTLVLDRGRRFTLTVLNVGLACCAVEAMVGALRPGGVVPYAGPDREVQVMVVSGTVTAKLAPLVSRLHASLPQPVRVIAFGACASSGGPYWDSYCVTAGVDQLVPVDLYVPGCPPRPEALLEALAALDQQACPKAADVPSGGLVRPAVHVGPQELRLRPLP